MIEFTFQNIGIDFETAVEADAVQFVREMTRGGAVIQTISR